MTAQEIFDKSAVGLLTQKEKSFSVMSNGAEGSGWFYRGANGKKCAAGFCIDDSDYKSEMEGRSIRTIVSRYNLGNLIAHVDILESLQFIHDSVSIDAWKAELLHLAKAKGLSTEKIDNL